MALGRLIALNKNSRTHKPFPRCRNGT